MKILGIAAIEQSHFPPFGKQRFFFEALIKNYVPRKFKVFFFSPLRYNYNQKNISGFVFINGEWLSCSERFPDIIYDRCFSSLLSEKEEIREFREFLKLNKITVFNPVALSDILDHKFNFHKFLHEHSIPTLSFQLPTEYLCQTDIEKHSFLLKPIQGSGGVGIVELKKINSDFVILNNKKQIIFQIDDILLLENELRRYQSMDFFLQKKIELELIEGSVFDIRVILQNSAEGYQISGIALRLGEKGSIVSNLMSGGKAMYIEEIGNYWQTNFGISSEVLQHELCQISFKLAQLISDKFGPFGEIGLDFLLYKEQQTNKLVIMEGNARPSRWVFQDIADRSEHIMIKKRAEKDRKDTIIKPLQYVDYLMS